MTQEAIPIEKEKAASVHVLTGTLTAVDEGAGTVDVTIDGRGDFSSVPVFYHCQGIETADGMPFIDGNPDRVVIVNYGDPVNLSVADMKVVGFEDGLPRACPPTFYFKLTRSDGVLITETSGFLNYILIYNSSNVLLTTSSPVYNVATSSWKVIINNSDIDPNGYWADYKCDCGFLTQYSNKIVPGDKRQAVDLIHAGGYEDIIPLSCFHFKITRDDGTLIDDSFYPYSIQWTNTFGDHDWVDTRPGHGLFYDSNISSPTYQHFWFEVAGPDTSGYWIDFAKVEDSVSCQYPKRCRGVDRRQPGDLIHPGVYSAFVPLWITSSSSSDPTYELVADCFLTCEELHNMAEHVHQYVFELCNYYWTIQKNVTETISVISSIPYMVSSTGGYTPGDISCLGYYSGGLYNDPTCPNTLPGPTCISYLPDQINLSGAGGMSVSCAGDESGHDTGSFIASGGGSYSASIVVITSDYEYYDDCWEYLTHHERIVTFAWEKLLTEIGRISKQISVSAHWDY